MARSTSQPARFTKKTARLSKRAPQIYLCFDLGGTKLMAAHITATGRILSHVTALINQNSGYEGLLALFRSLASELPPCEFTAVSVASAGPLHAERGLLLDPTNFFTGAQSWGVLPLSADLKRVFKRPVFLENDAAATALGEAWKGGHGQKGKNLIAITLGTGVGIGVIANGQLIRAGRGLHPEASHIPINSAAADYPCGCGANGCIEAYLAGPRFAKRLGTRLNRTLDGGECLRLAREERHPLALKAFEEYGRDLALSIRALVVQFAPEVVVLSGGFSEAWPHFLQTTQQVLPSMLVRYREGIDLLPEVQISKLKTFAGILGASRKCLV